MLQAKCVGCISMLLASVETVARADQNAPTLFFRNRKAGTLRQLLNNRPHGLRAVVNEQPAIGPGEKTPVRGLKERADEVALGLRGDVLNFWRVRVVAADASIGPEPDDLFAVNEDRIDVIGA